MMMNMAATGGMGGMNTAAFQQQQQQANKKARTSNKKNSSQQEINYMNMMNQQFSEFLGGKGGTGALERGGMIGGPGGMGGKKGGGMISGSVGGDSHISTSAERRLFDTIKDYLLSISRDNWSEFVKCLELFTDDKISKDELTKLIIDLLGDHGDLMNEFRRLLGTVVNRVSLLFPLF
jgi:histone deacetylase complex regulatory component SIN3